ncbi:MAG: ArsR/SmtB family transcription factor [Devosia sp.]|jgi:DNA-binding transcriptional ArsR family regulator|nr:metalloregulator ArsR/SmtB family transcription factor [Devosia sp.]
MNKMQDEEFADVMRALGHPVRLSILRILAERAQHDCCCTDVTECLPLAQSTVSQHIKVLLDAGLVQRSPKGTRNCYSLNAERLQALNGAFSGLFSGLAADLTPVIARTEVEPA